MNANQIASRANGSFTLPDICLKVQQMMEDESSTIEDFANVISVDPSLASRLLKIANSAIYNLPGQISTISRALTIIGTQALYNLVLIDAAGAAVKHFGDSKIDVNRFWRMSIYCALATKNLAVRAGIREIERMFVAGLLQNFGELIVYKVLPDKAEQCEAFDVDTLPWQKQTEVLGFSFSDVSAELLKLWMIPGRIILPIAHFNTAAINDINIDVKVLHIASRLTLASEYPDIYHINTMIDESLFPSLDLNAHDLKEAADFAKKETSNIMSIISSSLYSRP